MPRQRTIRQLQEAVAGQAHTMVVRPENALYLPSPAYGGMQQTEQLCPPLIGTEDRSTIVFAGRFFQGESGGSKAAPVLQVTS
jgi:hypothetical protein